MFIFHSKTQRFHIIHLQSDSIGDNVKFRYDTNVSNVSNVLLFDVEVYLGLKRMLGI